MKTLYEQAEEKVNNNASLWEKRDTILYDWPEGDEHWQWVLDANVNELV